MNLITSNIEEISQLCSKHHVKSLFAFGSIVRNKLTPESDIDFLVDIDNNDPLSYADDYFKLKQQLSAILKKEIDLLEQKAIKNKYLKESIDTSKVLVYGKGN